MGGWVEGWVNGWGHVKSLKIEILGSESFTRWLISNASARDSTSASDRDSARIITNVVTEVILPHFWVSVVVSFLLWNQRSWVGISEPELTWHLALH